MSKWTCLVVVSICGASIRKAKLGGLDRKLGGGAGKGKSLAEQFNTLFVGVFDLPNVVFLIARLVSTMSFKMRC
jgi:hypothetical protein